MTVTVRTDGEETDMTETGMRSTVSDCSGSPEDETAREPLRDHDAPRQRADGTGGENRESPDGADDTRDRKDAAGPDQDPDQAPDPEPVLAEVDGPRGMVPGPDPHTAPATGSTPVPEPGTHRNRVLVPGPDSGSRASAGTGAADPEVPPAASVADLVRDPGKVSVAMAGAVPVSGTAVRSGDDGDTWWDSTGRRHSVIGNETTASIPVHLLFRDDHTRPTGAQVRRPTGIRRPPVPRAPQVRTPTRPAPPVDPRLVERPGPVLPGWAALVTGAAGIVAGLATLWWNGALPATALGPLGIGSRRYDGIGIGSWAVLALLVTVVLVALGGIGRGRVGYASVLMLFGDYRGSVRRTGLIWVSPLLLRRRVDVRLRHWRSAPLPAVDASGAALRVVVLVIWRVKDTVRATLGVANHEEYLREQVEAATARVVSQLPADAFHEDTHTLRDAETVGDALTRMLKAECAPVGIEVYSAQPTGIEYAPEVAAAMQRCRVAAIDARHRDSVLTSVVDAVDDTVGRLTSRGIVELDAYEHKALVRDLTVAFYTGRGGGDRA